MKKSILNTILKRCVSELASHPEFNFFPHWTFILKNNRIVSSGKNNPKIPHIKWGYHSELKDLGFQAKTHSELEAVSKAREFIGGAIAINVRLSRLGLPRLSMPCNRCYNLLQTIGIKKCYFTTDNNWSNLTF